MNKICFLFLFTSSLVLLFSCKGKFIEPLIDDSLDTTSHAIDWEVESFGIPISHLSEIQVINENNIWVTGEVIDEKTYQTDSTGKLIQPFNALHWNGIDWEFLSLKSKLFSGDIIYAEINTLLAFNENDIWFFTSGGSYIHWNGNNWLTESIPNHYGLVYAAWGPDHNHMFVAGSNCSISFFDGNSWTLRNTGSDIPLLDIFGNQDLNKVLSCGYNGSHGESVLLSYNEDEWITTWISNQVQSELPYKGFLSSVWYNENNEFIICGSDGIYLQKYYPNIRTEKLNLSLDDFPRKVRGTASNDIFVVGNSGMIWHFNGRSWHEYSELIDPNIILFSVDVSTTCVAASGIIYDSGLTRGIIYKAIR